MPPATPNTSRHATRRTPLALLTVATLAASLLVACEDSSTSALRAKRAGSGDPSTASAKVIPFVTTDYLMLLFNDAVWRDLNFSVPTRVSLAIKADAALQIPNVVTPADVQTVLEERAEAVAKSLTIDEAAQFRRFYTDKQFATITSDGQNLVVPTYTSPNGWSDRSTWDREREAAAGAFRDPAAWAGLDQASKQMLTPKDAAEVLRARRDVKAMALAASWLTKAKVDPTYQAYVSDALRTFFAPLNLPDEWRGRPAEIKDLYLLAAAWSTSRDADLLLTLIDFPRTDPRNGLGLDPAPALFRLCQVAPDEAEKLITARIDDMRNPLPLQSIATLPAVRAVLERVERKRNPTAATVTTGTGSAGGLATFTPGADVPIPAAVPATVEATLRALEGTDRAAIRAALENVPTLTFPDAARTRLRTALGRIAGSREDFANRELAAKLLADTAKTPEEVAALLPVGDSDGDTPTVLMAAITKTFAADAKAAVTALEARASRRDLMSRLNAYLVANDPDAEEHALMLVRNSKPELQAVGWQMLQDIASETSVPALKIAAGATREPFARKAYEALTRRAALRPAGSRCPASSRYITPMAGNATRAKTWPTPLPPKDDKQALSWIDTGTASQRYAATLYFKKTPAPTEYKDTVHNNLLYFIDDGENELRLEAIRAMWVHGAAGDSAKINYIVLNNDVSLAGATAAVCMKLDSATLLPYLRRMKPEALDFVFTEITNAGPPGEPAAGPDVPRPERPRPRRRRPGGHRHRQVRQQPQRAPEQRAGRVDPLEDPGRPALHRLPQQSPQVN